MLGCDNRDNHAAIWNHFRHYPNSMLGWAKDPQGGLAECHLLETTQGVEFDISAIGEKARVDNFVFIKNYYFLFVGVHIHWLGCEVDQIKFGGLFPGESKA